MTSGCTAFDTPIGTCAVAWTRGGIARLALPESSPERTIARVQGGAHSPVRMPPRSVARAVERVRAHLEGRLDPLVDVALDLDAGTPFQQRVWAAARDVRPGETRTYGEIGRAIGSAGAARAVGAALGRNPAALVVPCHRVVGADGALVGFSAEGGTDLKRRLLEIEASAAPPERWLAARDPVMARLVKRHGPCPLRPDLADPFGALVRAIVYQQLTAKAAETMFGRLLETVGTVAPDRIAAASAESLRGAGLSAAKAGAAQDLARRCTDGRLDLTLLPGMDDEAVRDALVAVRGIGRWTADMFLVFRLGRPDVLPVGDYAVKKAVARAYGLRDLPDPLELERIAAPWRPHRSAACWYLWRTLDPPKSSSEAGR